MENEQEIRAEQQRLKAELERITALLEAPQTGAAAAALAVHSVGVKFPPRLEA